MTKTLRRDSGHTLVELMLVCTLALIVFGATLTAFTSIYRSNQSVERQNDNAEAARVALDRAARQLRNLSNPTVNVVTTIERALPHDLIFQTADPAKTWVRYCLQPGGGGAGNDATLWEHEDSGALPDDLGSCPGEGWDRTVAVVQHVTNQAGGANREVFTYECARSAPTGCPSPIADYSKIKNIGVDLWVDADHTDLVSELNVATSVFLRNQNEVPIASIGVPQRLEKERVLLNGSGSSDPEGRTLEYFWFENSPPSQSTLTSTLCTLPYPGAAWQGVTFNKKFEANTAGQKRTFYLLVRDPGCLTNMTSVEVTVPS